MAGRAAQGGGASECLPSEDWRETGVCVDHSALGQPMPPPPTATSVPVTRTGQASGQPHVAGHEEQQDSARVGGGVPAAQWSPFSANNVIFTENNGSPVGTWILTPVPTTQCSGKAGIAGAHGLWEKSPGLRLPWALDGSLC